VDKNQARGGEVIFTRTPSPAAFLMGENMGFPKTKYWINYWRQTGCHAFILPTTRCLAMICPENSHLSPAGSVVYTQSLISILQKENGWAFINPQLTNHGFQFIYIPLFFLPSY